MEKGELVALLSFPFWCLVIALWLFLAVPMVFLQFVIVVFPDHTHLLVLIYHLKGRTMIFCLAYSIEYKRVCGFSYVCIFITY